MAVSYNLQVGCWKLASCLFGVELRVCAGPCLNRLSMRRVLEADRLVQRVRLFATAPSLRVGAVIERRPVIYHMEQWEVEHEEWENKSRVAQMGRVDPIAKNALSLQTKMSGSSKASKDEGNAYSVKKKKMDLAKAAVRLVILVPEIISLNLNLKNKINIIRSTACYLIKKY